MPANNIWISIILWTLANFECPAQMSVWKLKKQKQKQNKAKQNKTKQKKTSVLEVYNLDKINDVQISTICGLTLILNVQLECPSEN